MKIRPLSDRIIVKREKSEEITKGGLYIPPNAQKKNTIAIVVRAGRGKMLENGQIVEPEVKMGDKVLINEWVGEETTINDEVCLILREESILGVIEE